MFNVIDGTNNIHALQTGLIWALLYPVYLPGYPELLCSQSFQFSYYAPVLTNIMPSNILNEICTDFQSSEK